MSNEGKKPEFKPGKSAALLFGNELLNGNIQWRNSLLEVMRYSDYNFDDVSELLQCSNDALLLIVNQNDPSLLGFKQGARLVTLHEIAKEKAKNNNKG
ncbi:MAG: hypothetical protein K2Q33_08795 [Gammaproteobacteria bacterium]|nr:hypothetical protein [Gammaproteobacteria bacterium]